MDREIFREEDKQSLDPLQIGSMSSIIENNVPSITSLLSAASPVFDDL
jgi:hypothetical protein